MVVPTRRLHLTSQVSRDYQFRANPDGEIEMGLVSRDATMDWMSFNG
jgi:hypothetical protein